MTLPAEWPVVEVRVGPYFGTGGTPLEGERVTFEPRVKRLRLLDDTIIVREKTTVTLDENGEGVTELPVSDDPDISMNGWTWQVREKFRWGQTYDIEVLTADVAAGIDLSDRAPVLPDEALGNWQSEFRDEMEDYAAEAAVSAALADSYVIEDLNTSDGQMEALVGSPTSLTSAAVKGLEFSDSSSFGGTYLKTVSDILNGGEVDVLRAIPRTQHAAILNGTSTHDATSEVQGLVTDMGAGTLVYPRGKYVQGNVQIEDKTGLRVRGDGGVVHLTGTASGSVLGFELFGTVEDFEMSGLHIIGDGVKANKHGGVWSGSGQNLANIRLHHMLIEQTMVGITLNSNLAGSLDGFAVTDNEVRDIVGIASGQGYGIHVALVNSGSAKGLIARNRGRRTGRHFVYVARGSDIDVIGNQSFEHRAALTVGEQADGTDGRGTLRPAFFVARSAHVRFADNFATGGYDGALAVGDNPEAAVGVECFDIDVVGNRFARPQNGVPLITIGDTIPSTSGTPEHVTVSANTLYADFGELTGVNSVEAIAFNCGKDVTISDNPITVLGVNQTTSAINLIARGESAGTATYSDDLKVRNNPVHMKTSNGSSCRAVRLDSLLLASAVNADIGPNEASGDARNNLHVLAAANTNPNLRTRARDGGCVGLYAAGDTTPSVGRGVTILPIANAGAVSITALDDGVDGQRVDLSFSDSNTTLVNGTNLRLVGGANFTPTIRDTIGFIRHGGTWYQAAPVVNN